MLWYHYLVIFSVIPIGMFIFYTRKYRNPYKLIMVFGKKGSGKSTLLTKLAVKYLRKNKIVYTTVPVPGCRLFDVSLVGKFNFPPESVVFIDEVGMIWDNRQYKNFSNDVRDWFKLQRHNRVTVYLFSQTFDVDVKLRNLTDYMYLVTCHFHVLSISRKIKRGIVIVNPDGQSEARIADSLEFEPVLLSLFGTKSIQFTWIPAWTKYFDSFSLPVRAGMPFNQLAPYSSSCKRPLKWRISRFYRVFYVRFRLFVRKLSGKMNTAFCRKSGAVLPPTSVACRKTSETLENTEKKTATRCQ